MRMRMNLRRPERGVALMQVLLLVAMLSVLLLVMVGNTQQQQRQVLAIQAQLDAHFALYSQSTDLQFGLLTEPWQPFTDSIVTRRFTNSGSERERYWSHYWNFYAQPFTVGDYQVRITNLNSLVNISGSGYGMFNLLQNLGYSSGEAQQLVTSLQQWQRAQNDLAGALPSQRQPDELALLPLQHVQELAFIPGWSEQLMREVAPFVTTFGTGLLNEAYMPDTMLEVVVSASQADIIRELRAAGNFNRAEFSAITGLEEDEFRSFFVGPDFRIELWHADNPAFARVLEVQVAPYQRQAIEIRYQGWE